MSVPEEVLQARTLIHKSATYWPEDRQEIAKQEMGFAVQQMLKNPFLAKIAAQNPESVHMAMQNVASVGLTLNPAEHLAYLVPRKIGGRVQVCFDPSYQGLLRLATNSGSVSWVHADVVYDNEEFQDRGIGEKPVHSKNPFKREGVIVGTYCVAKTSGGDYLTTTMPADEINGIRDKSEAYKAFLAGKAKSAGPWGDHYPEMAKKTVLRRAFKTWPRSIQSAALATAVEASNKNEGWEEIPQTSPDLGMVDDSVKAQFDQHITEDNGVALLVMRKGLTEREWTNLYHSFPSRPPKNPDGTQPPGKGHYQKIVDDLVNGAQAQIRQYVELLADAYATSDEMAISELLEEMSEAERDMVIDLSESDVALVIGRAAA